MGSTPRWAPFGPSVGIAVHANAEMAARIEGLATERARWSSSLDESGSCRGKQPRFRRAQADAQQVGSIRIVVGDFRIVPLVADRSRLEHQRRGAWVPAE